MVKLSERLIEFEKELKYSQKPIWEESSRLNAEADELRKISSDLVGKIAEEYIIKLLPELEKVYADVCRFVIVDTVCSLDQRMTPVISVKALDNLINLGKIEETKVMRGGGSQSYLNTYHIKDE